VKIEIQKTHIHPLTYSHTHLFTHHPSPFTPHHFTNSPNTQE